MDAQKKPLNNYRNFLLVDIRTFKTKALAHVFINRKLEEGAVCQYEIVSGIHQVRILLAV